MASSETLLSVLMSLTSIWEKAAETDKCLHAWYSWKLLVLSLSSPLFLSKTVDKLYCAMGQNHNLASLTRVRILLCVTLNWETGIYDPQINQSANHIQGVINAIMLNQCSRITDKTQDMSWRDTVGNVCVLGNSFSFFCPGSAMHCTPFPSPSTAQQSQ